MDSDRIKFHHDELNVDVYYGEYMAGSHNCVKRQYSGWKLQTHWRPLQNENVRRLLFEQRALSGKPVILYGELLGPGSQDLDYGFKELEFLYFDIKVGAEYLDFDDKIALFEQYGLKHVPILYRGPYSLDVVKELTSGPSVIGESSVKFKGREGIVITPVKEQYSLRHGRLIFKSISADYLARKNPTDGH